MKKLLLSFIVLFVLSLSYLLIFAKKELKSLEKPYEEYFNIRNQYNGEDGHLAKQMVLQGMVHDYALHSLDARGEETWNLQGPHNIGGRINTIAVNPDNNNEILVGCAAGGIFKTSNGGESWVPVFDAHAYLSIGIIVYHPQNRNVLFAGTGDPNIGGYVQLGDGIYKSEDGGVTWTKSGLDKTGIISKISINPKNPDVMYVATMGVPFIKDSNRGLYKSIDGGKTWENVLFIAQNAGVIDMVVVPEYPDTIFVSGWNRERTHFSSIAAGKESRVYRTFNGGESWDTLATGLPTGNQSRIGLALSKESNPKLLVQIVSGTNYETEGIYQTEDWGATFTKLGGVNLNGALGGFGWYFGKIRVNPWNPNEVYILGVDLHKSKNGGMAFEMCTPPWYTYEVHADKHDLVFVDEKTILLSTDGGMYKSEDSGETWIDLDLMPNTQFYRVAVDPHNVGYYAGGAQDNGTSYGNKEMSEWLKIWGGDGFQPMFSPDDNKLMYAETQWGGLVALEFEQPINSVEMNIVNYISFSTGIEETTRKCWDMPVLLSPLNSKVAYTGTYQLYKNSDAPSGSWVSVSEDLTDGTPDRYHVITAIGASCQNENKVLAGTSDGRVHLWENGEWENITATLPLRYITSVKFCPDNDNHLFISHTGYRLNEYVPYIHFSENNGSLWQDISGNLPHLAVNDVEILKQTNSNVIFVATDGGVYHTINRGKSWQRTGNGMPIIPVYDIVFDSVKIEMVAGTFARSLMTIDIRNILKEYNSVLSNEKVEAKIYPNPVNDNFSIEYSKQSGDLIKLYNVSGINVASWNIDQFGSFSVQNFPSGIYNIMIKRGESTIYSESIVVIK